MNHRDQLGEALRQAHSELDVPPPNWTTILARARKRLALRIAAVAAVAVAASLLLLGGGLTVHAKLRDWKEGGGGNGKENPNLAVASVTTTETVIKNRGGGAAGPFKVLVKIIPVGGQPPRYKTFSWNGLAAGESKTFKYPCHVGLTRVRVRSPRSEDRGESELGDNRGKATAANCGPPPPKRRKRPNLAVFSIGATETVIKNEGKKDAGPFKVVVEAVSSEGEPAQELLDEEAAGLPAGKSEKFKYECPGGSPTIEVRITPLENEPELDDNRDTKELICERSEEPNLAIGPVSETGAVIENNGDGVAGFFKILLRRIPAEGHTTEPLHDGPEMLEAGGTWELPIECHPGDVITVEVDPEDQVKESDETDNKSEPLECKDGKPPGKGGTGPE